ncbi:hypothetical protein M6B38_268515 [Iris pallida]|uniref:Uncharacterized protein n=1 Tax=Iris pallida TaxID=29817 RepID=A0AAX6FQN2_IRIPA|nr:hypothetical protein M6B38_131705 [Iris pallida]KAJ6850023.1 hypothetical protein M6B38_268515 [Iris pallida]
MLGGATSLPQLGGGISSSQSFLFVDEQCATFLMTKSTAALPSTTSSSCASSLPDDRPPRGGISDDSGGVLPFPVASFVLTSMIHVLDRE